MSSSLPPVPLLLLTEVDCFVREDRHDKMTSNLRDVSRIQILLWVYVNTCLVVKYSLKHGEPSMLLYKKCKPNSTPPVVTKTGAGRMHRTVNEDVWGGGRVRPEQCAVSMRISARANCYAYLSCPARFPDSYHLSRFIDLRLTLPLIVRLVSTR